MRLCLASVHPRRLSGQIESLVALARELERLGHQTTVVSPFDDDLLRGGVGLALARRDPGASALGKLLGVLRGFRRAAAAGRGADLLHLNLPTPAFSWLADALALQPGWNVPVVVGYEAHLADVPGLLRRSYLWHDPRFYLPRALVNNGLWGRCALFRCQRYVVASRWQRGELLALGVDEARLVSLPNLVDREKLRATPKATARAALLGEAGGGPLVGWAGHFHHVKGVDTLLEAFARLADERPDARLALAWSGIGDAGPIAARIRALGLGERTIRLGQVDIGQLLSAVDVMALPYRLTIGQGAFPNLVMEAMAVGVPLVTTDLPLLRELADDGQDALLVPPDDPAALAAALARLLDEPALAASMARAQHARMDGLLAPATLAARYVELYETVRGEWNARRHERRPAAAAP